MAQEKIELFVGLIETIDTPGALEACHKILSGDEIARADRFVFERHRRHYIFAHALLRLALSELEPGIAPSAWSFATGRYGRPFVAGPTTAAPLHFSLSHTEGCVACLISAEEAVGVDVEHVVPRGSVMETARGAFAPEEIEMLRGLPPREVLDRFFDIWTLKEAYLKARGFGLHLPLDGFAVRIAAGGIGISFKSRIDDNPHAWCFSLSSPSPCHRLAVADGSGVPGGLPVADRPLGPLWRRLGSIS
jgi:4'-phosphopantetheinyl transferase